MFGGLEASDIPITTHVLFVQ